MSKMLGYIGKRPFNEMLNTHLANTKGTVHIGTVIDNSICVIDGKVVKSNDIYTAIINYENSVSVSQSVIACGISAISNEDNLLLPFNPISKAKCINDTVLFATEYLKLSSKQPLLKSLNQSLFGDLSIMLYDKSSDSIYCQMGTCPIVIGLGSDYFVISTSIDDALPLASRFITLQYGEKAKITRDKITVFNAKNHRVKKSIFKLNQSMDSSDEFYLHEELFTLPASINSIINSTIKNDNIDYKKLKINKLNAKAYSKIVIISDTQCIDACKCSQKIFNVLCDTQTSVYLADEYLRESKNLDSSTLVLAVGEGNESVALIGCLSFAKKCNCKTIAFTQSYTSNLARNCTYTIKTPPMSRDSIYSISLDSFMTTYFSLSLFATHLAYLMGNISDVYKDVAIKMAQMLPGKIAQATKHTPILEKINQTQKACSKAIFTGCGIDYHAINNASKLFSKTAKLATICTNLFELKNTHIDSSSLIIAQITNKDYLNEFKSYLRYASAQGAKTIIIASYNIENCLNEFDCVVGVPDSLPIYSILTAIAFNYTLSIYCETGNEQKSQPLAM